jgi:hypothetical protein
VFPLIKIEFAENAPNKVEFLGEIEEPVTPIVLLAVTISDESDVINELVRLITVCQVSVRISIDGILLFDIIYPFNTFNKRLLISVNSHLNSIKFCSILSICALVSRIDFIDFK